MTVWLWRRLHVCDENCRCCEDCYQRTGHDICRYRCRHGRISAALRAMREALGLVVAS